jgi:hypothetical protein
MMDWLKQDAAGAEDLGEDMVLAEALRSLDPATEDPNYWLRFRSWVMSEAAFELARRRRIVELSVEDVLASWSRTLLPVAMAAAVAAVAFIRSPQADAPTVVTVVGVEELLVAEVREETQPVLLSPDAAAGIVAFASDVY